MIFILAVMMTVTMYGAKALSRAVTVTQPDGSRVTVRQYGDEHLHYYMTTDGVLVYHDGPYYYVAATDDAGRLTKTSQPVHEAAERTETEKALIAAQDRDLFFSTVDSSARQMRVMREAVDGDGLLACEGSPRVPVILAQFSDVAFTVNDAYQAFDQYLNGDEQTDLGNYNTRNYSSVKKYFEDMSFEAFSPQFDLYGPVTLEHELSYYGGGDDNMSLFVPDVCKAMDDSLDFSQYDDDGDGYVDLLYIIYAGYSESIDGNSSDCIWPKSGTISGGTYDGVSVRRYGVNNELNFTEDYATSKGALYVNGIGLFCHEFSHCLGLPDLYVTVSGDLAYADNQEMEYWSIMDSGTYLYNGYSPAAYTAWEREALGWMSIDTLTEAGTVELWPIDDGGRAYRIMNDADTTGKEYFIVENIQQTGHNYKQYGHGMIVTHVDYDATAFSLSSNTVNNTEGHPRMTVVAADGQLQNAYTLSSSTEAKTSYGGDPFPGTGGVTELTDTSDVAPTVYNGTALGKPLYDISEDDDTGAVTFSFLTKADDTTEDGTTEGDTTEDGTTEDDTETQISNVTATTTDSAQKIYHIDGRRTDTAKSALHKGIYIVGDKKIVVK